MVGSEILLANCLPLETRDSPTRKRAFSYLPVEVPSGDLSFRHTASA